MCTFEVKAPYPGEHPDGYASAWKGHTFEINEDLEAFIRMHWDLKDHARVFVVQASKAVSKLEDAGKYREANYWEKRFSVMIVFPNEICKEVSPKTQSESHPVNRH